MTKKLLPIWTKWIDWNKKKIKYKYKTKVLIVNPHLWAVHLL